MDDGKSESLKWTSMYVEAEPAELKSIRQSALLNVHFSD